MREPSPDKYVSIPLKKFYVCVNSTAVPDKSLEALENNFVHLYLFGEMYILFLVLEERSWIDGWYENVSWERH